MPRLTAAGRCFRDGEIARSGSIFEALPERRIKTWHRAPLFGLLGDPHHAVDPHRRRDYRQRRIRTSRSCRALGGNADRAAQGQDWLSNTYSAATEIPYKESGTGGSSRRGLQRSGDSSIRHVDSGHREIHARQVRLRDALTLGAASRADR
jgi:hypothetical protein